MKMIMALVIVGFVSSTASFAAPGPQSDVKCKDILQQIKKENEKRKAAAEGKAAPAAGEEKNAEKAN